MCDPRTLPTAHALRTDFETFARGGTRKVERGELPSSTEVEALREMKNIFREQVRSCGVKALVRSMGLSPSKSYAYWRARPALPRLAPPRVPHSRTKSVFATWRPPAEVDLRPAAAISSDRCQNCFFQSWIAPLGSESTI